MPQALCPVIWKFLWFGRLQCPAGGNTIIREYHCHEGVYLVGNSVMVGGVNQVEGFLVNSFEVFQLFLHPIDGFVSY